MGDTNESPEQPIVGGEEESPGSFSDPAYRADYIAQLRAILGDHKAAGARFTHRTRGRQHSPKLRRTPERAGTQVSQIK